ncbi:hypothetical protein PHLGIDRAFT_13290 [Phlebiopsis gigantea 11061_1 CR5-6]|uniref:LysM domain-containing protein n=1 Tax=Phlebiopsis gigantea (strain 11061_1 CR5-6) TaxID=745531 RepID=A0A0C3PLK2_PHLG1|nr:hypothetical protein PHLGIDRAFT_13290 [Phlebiopsis gigantea 11061_1 CR5-6]
MLNLAVLVLATVFIGALAQFPSDCDRTYSVQAGDTCNSISENHDVSSFQLAFVNTVINADCSNLFIGQLLCLGRNGQDCTIVHTVGDGESCVEIANNAGTPLNVLLENNQNVNATCSNLIVGEVLCTEMTLIPYHSS